jgi:hypothetical protein
LRKLAFGPLAKCASELEGTELAILCDLFKFSIRTSGNWNTLDLSECFDPKLITEKFLLRISEAFKISVWPLTALNLKNCDALTDNSLQQLCQLATLRRVDISNCNKISHNGVIEAVQLIGSRLRYLSLSGCAGIQSEEFMEPLTQLATNLLHLDLSKCPNSISSTESLECLGELKCLEYLNLANAAVAKDAYSSDILVSAISNMANLKYLNVSG